MFPIVGSILVWVEDGFPDGLIEMHLRLRLMQIIDLAPFVLGVFSFLLGLNVDRREQSDRLAKEVMAQKVQLQEQLAAKLQVQNDELRELNETLDGLVYTASHDLKTPLINFESMLRMLKQVKDKPGSEKMVDEIIGRMEAATVRFQSTIADLLEVSRMERSPSEPMGNVSLRAMLIGLQREFDSYLASNAASLRVDLEADLVRGWEMSIASIFQNLISNAIKYKSPDRAPVIQISSRETAHWVEVRVEDNGTGIDLSVQRDKLFQMFTRLHREGEGSGIGLYIVKRTVANLGGEIDLESTLGVGTTFVIKLQKNQPI